MKMYKESLNNLQKHIQILNKPKTTPKFEIKKWELQIIRIFEFIFTTLFFRKRMLTKATINALYNLEIHDTNKIKTAIDFEFLVMKVYLKTFIEKMK